MHMVQHMLLLDLVPILAIVGFTKVILRPVTRLVRDVEAHASLLASPAFAVILYIGVIWAWHVPAAYDVAVRHPLVHLLEHVTFLLAGSLYWWHLLSPIRARLRLGGMGPIVYMGSTKLFVGALGMGLAFAPSALYPYYVHHARVWGISAHDDQAIAGLDHGRRAVARDGHRARRPVRAGAGRVRARAAAARALRTGVSRAMLTTVT